MNAADFKGALDKKINQYAAKVEQMTRDNYHRDVLDPDDARGSLLRYIDLQDVRSRLAVLAEVAEVVGKLEENDG